MIQFRDLVDIYQRLQFNKELQSGKFYCRNDEDCKKINLILKNTDDYGISLNEGNIEIDNTITLDISLPSSKLGCLFKNIEQLIRNPNNRCIEPINYYVIDISFYSEDLPDELPHEIKKYKSIISFLDLLKSCAAYFDKTSCELIFLNSSILKIPVMYFKEDIDQVSEKSIENIKSYFLDEIHLDQKKEILSVSIYSLCDKIDKNVMFSHLLHNIDDLKLEYEKGYKIFTSGFSYRKIVDELRSKKIEAIGKIHKTFSDIQNQILAIPIATLIAATQMKMGDSGYQILINIVILFGCFVFGVLVWVSLINQKHTLDLMEEEIKFQIDDIKNKYHIFESDIKINLESIESRISRQKYLFVFIQVVLIIGILISFISFCYTIF